MPDERKDVGNALGEGQAVGSLKDGDLETRGVCNGVSDGTGGTIQVSDGERKVQQQLQGPVVRWERFLPFRSLKVLLVENDDCTRHVVTALLRNCSYEVVAVANGLQAWRYLEDLTNHTDLILTEVVMPVISGVGLLCKIMNHKTFKNIPVIMMSSHDSMGIVFKCLSRGAVDFLGKPIRKNELKNLWQHVWRRCHYSSGSDSESGTMSRKSIKCKSSDIPNDSSKSNGQHYGSTGPSSSEDDDEGSGAQSSWTERAAEIGSSQPTGDEFTEAPDSTCAQVIQTKLEPVTNRTIDVKEDEESKEQNDQFGKVSLNTAQELGMSQYQLLQSGTTLSNQFEKPTSTMQKELPESDCILFGNHQTGNYTDSGGVTREIQHAGDMSRMVTSSNMQGGAIEGLTGCAKDPIEDKVILSSSELPFWGISSEKERYTCGSSSFQVKLSQTAKESSRNIQSLLPLDSGIIEEEAGALQAYPLDPTGISVETAIGKINHSDKKITPALEALADGTETATPPKVLCSSMNAVQYDCSDQIVKTEKAENQAVETQVQPRESQQVHVEHHHHHYHHYHHHIHDVQHHQKLVNQDQCSLENTETAAVRCGSSNAFTETGEGNTGFVSINGSGSGSQHGSNGKVVSQHGSNEKDVMTNAGNVKGTAVNNEYDTVNGKIVANESEDRFTQRDATLTKLRQKRKERSFEKKARNQSRKKVVELQLHNQEQYVTATLCDSDGHEDRQPVDLESGKNSCDSFR